MHFSTIAIATLATVGPLADAHGSTGLPQIIGLDVADVKARSFLRSLGARMAESSSVHEHKIEARETSSPPNCGEGIGSCPAGKCCSTVGYCGTTDAHCYSPGCQYKYGPGCDENNPPSGSNTSSIARDKVGSVAYGGSGIYRCTQPGTVALTYDDGPQTKFTEHILDLLKSYNAKATFFMTGSNISKGRIDVKHADVIKRVDAEGHQVASHTWTHLDLSKVSSLDRKNQMWMNEMALRNVLGKIPTYMRPPYSSCTVDSGCQQDMADLGYHVSYFNVDTDDYNQNTADHIQTSKDRFKNIITNEGASAEKGDKWLSIGHDILDQTANNLTEYMLQTLQQLGYKAVTIGDCLGDPKANWYRSTDGSVASTANSTESSNQTSSSGSSNNNNSNNNNNQASGGSGSGSGTSSGSTPATGAASALSSTSMSTIALLISFACAYVI